MISISFINTTQGGILLGAIFVAVLLIAPLFLAILRKKHARNKLRGTEYVIIRLYPPREIAFNEKSSQQLFKILSEMGTSKGAFEKLIGTKDTYSLEICVNRFEGICYYARIPHVLSDRFENAVRSYLPTIKTSKVTDYAGLDDATIITEFKQANHFAYPIRVDGQDEETDPVNYLLGYMRDVAADNAITLQIVLTPSKPRAAMSLRNELMSDERKVRSIKGENSALHILLSLVSSLASSILNTISSVGNGQALNKHELPLSEQERSVVKVMTGKLNDKLFLCDIRVGVRSDSSEVRSETTAALRTAMRAYDSDQQQYLTPRGKTYSYLKAKSIRQNFVLRHPSARPAILSAAEVSAIFHFPSNSTHHLKNLDTSITKVLPAPLDQKRNKLAISLGINSYHGEITKIGLTERERERHMFVLGSTGSGKSTLAEGCFIEDISNGNGAALIDPHGDSAVKMLSFVPKNRIDDVIYFNPADTKFPIGLNLLELKVAPGATEDEIEEERERVVESIISIFRKTFSEDGESGGHRIEYVLRCALLTAMSVPDATIFTVYRLLNDPTYRKQVVKTLSDKDLVSFWKKELGSAGKMQEIKMYAGITSKIGRFLFSRSAKRIFGQEKSTIDFDEIIDGKILICNLSKGKLGEDISSVYGTLILEQIKLAGFRRVTNPPENRIPFYVYVDEFQNFATKPFIDMLAESRKYRLFITMLEQSTSQQSDHNITNTILANVGTLVCFRSASPQDEKYMLPILGSAISEGDVINLESYNFYVRILAHKPQPTFSGITQVPNKEGELCDAEDVILSSRQKYANTDIKTQKTSPKKAKSVEQQVTLTLPGD